jgi:hypothetical protein
VMCYVQLSSQVINTASWMIEDVPCAFFNAASSRQFNRHLTVQQTAMQLNFVS